jgi:hypothetical protein
VRRVENAHILGNFTLIKRGVTSILLEGVSPFLLGTCTVRVLDKATFSRSSKHGSQMPFSLDFSPLVRFRSDSLTFARTVERLSTLKSKEQVFSRYLVGKCLLQLTHQRAFCIALGHPQSPTSFSKSSRSSAKSSGMPETDSSCRFIRRFTIITAARILFKRLLELEDSI